jgi:hypothetical protein
MQHDLNAMINSDLTLKHQSFDIAQMKSPSNFRWNGIMQHDLNAMKHND